MSKCSTGEGQQKTEMHVGGEEKMPTPKLGRSTTEEGDNNAR